MNKVYIIIALGILAAGILAAKSLNTKKTDLQTTATPTPSSSPLNTDNEEGEPDNTENWETYSDNELGIEIKYPENFKIEESGDYSILASPKESEDKVGMPRFFYLSVVPSDYSESDLEVIYNYNIPDFQKLNRMNVGESLSLTDTEGLKEWFTYKRLEDVNVNKKEAKVFVNDKPWEFPSGTKEIRYIFEVSGRKVIAGGYVDGPTANGTFPESLFKEIINTLEIK